MVTVGRHTSDEAMRDRAHGAGACLWEYLEELHEEGDGGPAEVEEGHAEDVEHPGGTAHQAREGRPQALVRVVQRAVL